MRYIYCYENKINGHKYVGQTNSLKTRYSAHKSQAFNPNSKDYNCLFHKKIRQYGLENFDFYVLEEIQNDDEDCIDFKEQFWIEKMNSWCRNGQGYNETSGGKQFKKNLSLTDQEILEIKDLLKNSQLTIREIAEKFNTYRECVSRINKGQYCYDEKESYPIRITKTWKQVPQEVKEQIAEEIITTKTPLKEIAKKYSISEHLINQINNGESNLQGKYIYPLRKTNKKLTIEQEKYIYEQLLNKRSCISIAKELNLNRGTVEKRKKKYGF